MHTFDSDVYVVGADFKEQLAVAHGSRASRSSACEHHTGAISSEALAQLVPRPGVLVLGLAQARGLDLYLDD